MPKHKQDVGELWITFLSQFVFHFFKSADAGIFLLIFVLFTFQFKCKGCNFNCINWKIHRWWAWDSNPGWQDGRRRRIHWPPVFHFFKNGPFPASFSLFLSFQDSWQYMFNLIFCLWLDSKCGPLELEGTALPTEPQPLCFTFYFPLFWFLARNRPTLNRIKKLMDGQWLWLSW